MEQVIFLILGLLCGFAISSGVFALITALSLIPRMADKTHTGKHMMLYESCVLYGSLLGNIIYFSQETDTPFTLLPFFVKTLGAVFPYSSEILYVLFLILIPVLIGGFSGIFVGTLAVSIAESLNVTAVFLRRSKLHTGLGMIVLSFALGKAFGSLFFFLGGFFDV